MKKFSCCVIALHILFLGVTSSTKSQAIATKPESAFGNFSTSDWKSLPQWAKSKVWVIGRNQKLQHLPLIWVATNTQKTLQQPFLLVESEHLPNRDIDKSRTAKPSKKGWFRSF